MESFIAKIESALEKASSPIGRDLKLNLTRILSDSALSPEEGALTLAALGQTLGLSGLKAVAEERLKELDFSPEQVLEAKESAAMLGMLNTYYRFKYLLEKDSEYSGAGLRMTSLAKPSLGKEKFEMLAFAVSVVNGCQSCVKAHEHTLREAGVTVAKIHDLARLASVAKGISALVL